MFLLCCYDVMFTLEGGWCDNRTVFTDQIHVNVNVNDINIQHEVFFWFAHS